MKKITPGDVYRHERGDRLVVEQVRKNGVRMRDLIYGCERLVPRAAILRHYVKEN